MFSTAMNIRNFWHSFFDETVSVTYEPVALSCRVLEMDIS